MVSVVSERRGLLAWVVVVVLTAAVGDLSADEPVLLRWKFVEGKQYSYDYTQESVSKQDFGKNAIVRDRTGGGTLLVVCGKEEAKVRLSFKIIKASVDGKAVPKEDLEGQQAITGEWLMSPDGKLGEEGAGGNIAFFVDLFFALPEKPLEPGKSVEQKMTIPGSGIPDQKGTVSFQHMGSETIGGLRCVKYRVSAVLGSQSEAREALQSRSILAAEMDCVFALDVGYFKSVTGKMTFNWTANGMMAGEPVNMKTEISHEIAIRLKAIEDIPKDEHDPAPDDGDKD